MSADPSPLEQAAAQLLTGLLASGEWREGLAGHYNVVAFDGDDITGVAQAFGPQQRTFIAAAPQLVRDLLAELQRLRLSLEARTQERDQLHNDIDAFHRNDHDHQGAAVTWHACYREVLAAKDVAEARVQALEAERDKWLGLFNRSEQFQDGPRKQLADLQAALQGLIAEMRELVSRGEHAHGVTVLDWSDTLEALVRPQQTTEKKKDDAAYQPNSPVGPQCPACGCRHWRGHNTLCSR